MTQAVFLDLQSLNPSELDLAPLRACAVDWRLHDHTADDAIVQRIENADIVVTNKVPLCRAAIQATPRLKLICVAATGVNNIDLNAAGDAGIVVSNARDYATASVVEHVFLLMLTLVRQLDAYRERVTAGDWTRSPYFCLFDAPIEELSGKKLGIIGFGVLGQAVAQLARAFSMQVKVAQRLHGAPLADRTPLDELLATSDVISLHCPLTDQTRGLIGASQLKSMKRNAVLINTARGGIIDESALITALERGWIAAAGIDVLAQEPPAAVSPLLRYRSPRLIVTPHIAWASRAARQRLIAEIIANIEAFLQTQPRNRVR